ncbi:hypothetical protein BDR03DRAFT_935318 [Suillus americanus]|nr:hypothetical protein BDR03DRAFT_935318 [Suillus americanus]
MEYHPTSGQPTIIESFSVYGRADVAPPFVNNSPWLPFLCCAGFEFAELAHQAALSKEHMDKFLQLIWNVVDGHVKLTFKTHGDVSKAWDKASTQMTPFKKHVISVDYQKGKLDFDIYSRPLWDWAMDLLNQPILAPHLNGMLSGYHWWRIQSSLPNDGVPFAFILYVEKTHLLSYGNVKGYPVIARCTNLPVHIQNCTGAGGGRLVGWLPIVPKDAEEDHKLSYTNLKHIVWHEAFLKFLEIIILYSKTGFAHKCFDNVTWWLYALILLFLILLTFQQMCDGINMHCPCPICLVPSTKLCDRNATYPVRKVEDAQMRVKLYKENHVVGEAALKEQGLRPIQNVFWRIANSDPHKTISQDQLHALQCGVHSYYMHEEVKKLAEVLGRNALKQIDEQFDAFPQWQGFNHFHRVTNISFSDGNKFRDISKQILFASHNMLTKQKSKAGYMLLRCIASYLAVDMYVLLDTHTESTLAAGKVAYQDFLKHLDVYTNNEYIDVAGDSTKNWNFPKVHAGKHIFHDIREKGTAWNFSTRPNKKQHGPLKQMYLCQTNHKDIAKQLLQLDHRTLVSKLIGARIAHHDEQHLWELRDANHDNDDNPDDNNDPEDAANIGASFEGHIYLGSPQCPTTFADVEELQEYHYLKVHYESVVDWKLATDYLCCSPLFHGHERCDCALIRTHNKDGNDKNIFAWILFMFKYTVGDRCLELALVLPMDAPIGPRPALRAWPAASSEFISVHSIICGALLVPDYAHPD